MISSGLPRLDPAEVLWYAKVAVGIAGGLVMIWWRIASARRKKWYR